MKNQATEKKSFKAVIGSTLEPLKIVAITPKELEFLTAIDHSEYGDNIMDDVWFFTIADNSSLSKASLGGITASLLEKGLIAVQGEHTAHKKADQYEHCVGFTRDGVASYLAALGYDVSKARKWISDGLREALDDALAPTASTGGWLAYAGRVAAKASENEASAKAAPAVKSPEVLAEELTATIATIKNLPEALKGCTEEQLAAGAASLDTLKVETYGEFAEAAAAAIVEAKADLDCMIAEARWDALNAKLDAEEAAAAVPAKVSRQTRHVEAVKAAGGSRRTFLLSADATDALARWKAHTGATSDREAVELALLAAVLRVGGAV